MASTSDESFFEGNFRAGDDGSLVERTQELTWALVDEQINDDEMRLLDSLLLSDDGARDTYIACMQLHSDLVHHHAEPAKANPTPTTGQSPVLGFLASSTSPFEAQPPRAEDSRA